MSTRQEGELKVGQVWIWSSWKREILSIGDRTVHYASTGSKGTRMRVTYKGKFQDWIRRTEAKLEEES